MVLNIDTSAFKIHNLSLDIQQMSGEVMIDYKIIGISTDRVLTKMKGILQLVSNMREGQWDVHMMVWV